MAKVQVLCGAHRSQRCAQIDQVMRSHWGRSFLLTPTHGYARVRRERLLLTGAAQGCWGNPVREFKDFVVHLLAMEGMHVRLLEDFERLLLLEQALAGETVAERVAALNLSTENSGFLRHLLAVITQLKQAAVEPEVFQERIKDGETHPFDALVATAYEAYQAMLASSNTYDVPGLYWQASLAAHSKAPRALQGIEVLLLDGFDDFTPSQLRLLATLSKHFDTIVFGINYEDVPNRQDLYTLSAKTLAQLRDCFDVEMVQLSSSAPRRYSEYAADQLFWRDKPVMPSDLAVDVRGVPCMDYAQETEVLARRIKKLVVEEGVPPEDIALVYRGLQGVASQLKRTFASFEIPLRMSHQPNLCESAVGAFVLRFFEAISEWGREPVLAVLSAPWWREESQETEDAPYALLTRCAKIVGGYTEWEARLQRLSERLESAQEADQEVTAVLRCSPDAAAWTQRLLTLLVRMKGWAERVPTQATQGGYAQVLDELLTEWALDTRLSGYCTPEQAQDELSAWKRLRRLLALLARPIYAEKKMTCTAFVQRLTQGMSATKYAVATSRGGVACHDALTIRNLDYAYVFFAGLVEGETPQRAKGNAIYSDVDLRRLQQQGIPLEGRREHGARERLLFHHVLSAARHALCLSWSVTRGDGQPATPSPYLSELLDLFSEVKNITEPLPLSDAFVPAQEDAASLRDVRAVAFLRTPELQKTFVEECARPAMGRAIEEKRYAAQPFGPYDGVLCCEEEEKDHTSCLCSLDRFSVNQLELYLHCPFHFFAERVLGVMEGGWAEAEFDARVRGIILHDALECFHRHYLGKAICVLPVEEADAVMSETVDAVFKAHDWKSVTAPTGVVHVERKRMKRVLQRYLDIARSRSEKGKEDAGWRPMHFEVSFGRVQGEQRDPLSNEKYFVVETDVGPVRFSGCIDRIDIKESLVRIVDYKSSTLPGAGEITTGNAMQLTVYQWVVQEHLFPDSTCTETWYLTPGHAKYQSGMRGRGTAWEFREENTRARIAAAVKGIREGYFPPTPDDPSKRCGYCPYRSACRYEEARVRRKKAVMEDAQ